jgi:hypothetical protein
VDQRSGAGQRLSQINQLVGTLIIGSLFLAVLAGGVAVVVVVLFQAVIPALLIPTVVIVVLFLEGAYLEWSRLRPVRPDREARAAEVRTLRAGLDDLWRDGDGIKWRIEHNWTTGDERNVDVYTIQVTEVLEQARPQFITGFLNDGFPDGGIQPRAGWTVERKRAFRDITVRLHRLKEEVLDRLETEEQAILAQD